MCLHRRQCAHSTNKKSLEAKKGCSSYLGSFVSPRPAELTSPRTAGCDQERVIRLIVRTASGLFQQHSECVMQLFYTYDASSMSQNWWVSTKWHVRRGPLLSPLGQRASGFKRWQPSHPGQKLSCKLRLKLQLHMLFKHPHTAKKNSSWNVFSIS